LILAFAIRVWGVTWSLPYVGHVDEPKIVDSAVHIVKTGDFNPHLFIWPSLVIYIQALIEKLNLIWGTWRGTYSGPASLPDQNHIFALAPDLYLWGRTFSALVGAATVTGVYLLGRGRLGRPAALAAALLLGTSPIQIEYSHYLVTDVTVGACGLLALAAAWSLAERPSIRAAGLAGAAVGLCAAAKYNGLYIALPVAVAWLLAWRRDRQQPPPHGTPARWLAVGAGMGLAAAIVFLIANPYVLLDWRAWSRGFVFQVNAYVPATDLDQVGTALAKQLNALWQTDLFILAPGVLGGVLLLIEAIRTRHTHPERARAAWLLLPFPPLYVLAMSRFTEVYERNLIITLPFLALTAGYGLDRLATTLAHAWPLRRPRTLAPQPEPKPEPQSAAQSKIQNPKSKIAWLAVGLAILLGAEPARRMINFDRYMAVPESRNQAAAWLSTALRAGDRAAVELHPLQLCAPPPFACPAPDVLAPNSQLTDRPPAWYAAHGYDYVMLVGSDIAFLGNPGATGRRPGGTLAPYLALPLVQLFAGDEEGGKGPTVRVFRTASSPVITGATRNGAHFGTVAELWGYALAPLPTASTPYDPAAGPPPGRSYRPGGAVGVHLYWRALPGGAPPGKWTVALHLLDGAGTIVAQVDVEPISSGHLRPVRAWYPNEFLDGSYNIPLPGTLAAGPYQLTLALYDPDSGRTLAVQAPDPLPTPALTLGTLQLVR